MAAHDDLVVALSPFIDLLERLGVVWYVGGSVASTVHGHFRATNDVDVIADRCRRPARARVGLRSVTLDALGPYRIDRERGSGGMGKVYAATVAVRSSR